MVEYTPVPVTLTATGSTGRRRDRDFCGGRVFLRGEEGGREGGMEGG